MQARYLRSQDELDDDYHIDIDMLRTPTRYIIRFIKHWRLP